MSSATLSLKKRVSKYHFNLANEKTPSAEKVKKYLEEVHEIKVPENFASKLIMAHRAFRSTPFHMNLSLVDSIVEACVHWLDYVEDWDALVCREVLSMARIHTSVIWLRSLDQNGIVLRKQPSYLMETTVTYDGLIRVCNC